MAKPRDVIIFDLDRTLTKGPSFTPFLLMVAREEPEKFLYVFAVLFQMVLYLLKIKSRKSVKEYMLKAFLTGMSKNQIGKAAKVFLKRLEDQNKFYRDGLKALKAHREKGDRILIATASMDFYVEEIAKKLNADDMIATKSIWEKGLLVPVIQGENCYGAEKAKRVQTWLAQNKTGLVWFYSDHHTDEPTFELVDKKVAVNPTAKLRKIAAKKGYDIQIWT